MSAKRKRNYKPALQDPRAGLREVEAAPGSHYKMLVADGAPTVAQRVLMAKRVQEHQGRGHYVQAVRSKLTKEVEMSKKDKDEGRPAHHFHSSNAGLTPEEIDRKLATPAPADKPRAKFAAALGERAAGKPQAAKPQAAKPRAKASKPPAKPARAGRPAKDVDAGQVYVVKKDNTRSGHMKTFMAAAGQLKKFTRQQLLDATKAKVTATRAERYFDYCLYKGLIQEKQR
jgi:hypothetical protein